MDELNQAPAALLDRCNAEVVKYLNAGRSELFEQLDKLYLTAPQQIYLQGALSSAGSIRYHIQLEKCFYSVPYKLTSEKVDVHYNTRSAEIIITTPLPLFIGDFSI